MLELSEKEQQAVDTLPETRLIDPRTKNEYVLIRAELFDRLKSVLTDDAELDMKQVAILVERAMAEYDENDPSLEVYQ